MGMDSGTCVAFTGHRSYRHEDDAKLHSLVEQLYAEGARTFRVGMAVGFDLAAGEAVERMLARYGDITLEAYIPFPGFDLRFSSVDRLRYSAILRACAKVSYAAVEYEEGAFRRRNDMLVDGASVVVAWWNGSSSGTGYTVRQARRCGARVINIYPVTQCSLEF